MTETLTKVVVDCSTGESTVVPLTDEEIAQREADRIAYEAAETERAAAEAEKAAQKAVLLERLGLTAEEAALLGL